MMNVRSLLSILFAAFFLSAPAWAEEPAEWQSSGMLTLDPGEMQKPWSGDLDGMIERGVIRVLTVNSKSIYFTDKGTPHGTAVEFFQAFENALNKQLAAEKKLKHKHLKVRVVFIPMHRADLLPALAAGKGDIAAANLTITPERLKLVDFTRAGLTNVREVVVSGPASPAIAAWMSCPGKTSSSANRPAITRAWWPSISSSQPPSGPW